MTFPIQNQTSQLKLKFAGPLVKDWQVALKQDLVTLDNNYDYKLVWVNEIKSLFYLNAGCSGADLSHWIQYGSSATITEHNQNQSYTAGECVYTLNGGLYVAVDAVPSNTPITNTDYWLQLSGSSVTMYVEFTNQSEVLITSLVTHPIFQIFVDDMLVDAEVVNTSVENNIWKISFYEDNELSAKTGYVVIK
jgi:hypothetical protein